DAEQQGSLPAGGRPADSADVGRPRGGGDENVRAQHHTVANRPGLVHLQGGQHAGQGKRVVEVGGGPAGQQVVHAGDAVDAVRRIEPAHADRQASEDLGNTEVRVELHRVEPVEVRLPVVRGELAVEEPPGECEAVVRSGEDAVDAEADVRL